MVDTFVNTCRAKGSRLVAMASSAPQKSIGLQLLVSDVLLTESTGVVEQQLG
jgi:hypothetical protein